MANSVVVAIGSNQLWAFTPAIDLLQHAVTPATEEAAAAAAASLAKASAESTEAVAVPASSSGKSSASSALARLLLKAAPSPAPAPAAPAIPAGGTGSLSLLLVDSGDILSALKTAVRSHTHRPSGASKDAPLQLYLLDAESSSTARHLLLLSIAFDTSLSLRGRTELFLEVYGNALIQEKTQRFINAKVKEIRKYMSSLQVLTPASSSSNAAASGGASSAAAPIGDQALSASLFRHTVDLSHLKNRELDALENALDFMTTPLSRPSLQKPEDPAPITAGASVTLIEEGDESNESDEVAPAASTAAASSTAAVASVPSVPRVLPQKDGNAFDVETLRDHRLRGYFADRYDARVNLIDWDYHMRLKAVASIIHPVHYKKWRMTGVAFEERLCTYTYPNRSFASYRDAKSKTRGSVSVRGYWSDTLVSPYITLGVEANDRRLFNRKNHQHVKTSPHVCEYNLLSLLYELETGTPYALPKKKEDLEKAAKQQKSKGQKTPAEEAKEKDEEEIVQLPDEVALPQESASEGSSSSAPLLASPVVQGSSSGASASGSSTSAVSSSASPALNHTTPHALSLAHVRFVLLNGTAQALAMKSRYAHAFDGAYLSQFQVGCINETAAARATQEAKQAQAGSGAPAPAAAASAGASSAAPAAPDSLPLNQLLRPGARVTVETVKFLPVTAEVKDAYRSRVSDLAQSAGWVAASPPGSAWSEGYSHSWTDRTVEQPQEEADKEQALTQPAHLHFVLPADSAAQKK